MDPDTPRRDKALVTNRNPRHPAPRPAGTLRKKPGPGGIGPTLLRDLGPRLRPGQLGSLVPLLR